MANHMTEVAKLLGVELNEEFEIIFPAPSSCHATAMFTDNGVQVIKHNVFDAYNFQIYLLKNLLTGYYSIKHMPWKPKYGEAYWCVNILDGVICNSWADMWMDIIYYKLGNCYRTNEEAEANIEKWKAFYVSDEILEV